MPNSLPKSFQLSLQPTPAWSAILGLVLFLALGLLAGAGRLLILAFPLGSLAVGAFLYQRYPVFYASFTWWMWFLGPFVRRAIDYQCGYVTPGPWNLTPMLVTGISLMTFVRYFPQFCNQEGLPFILCLGSVLYAFFVGLIYHPISDATVLPLLAWLTPILFGFHLFVHWREYPSYRQTIQQTFLWGVLVMGVYGIWQYFVAPGWDRFWLTNVDNPTYGFPAPLKIRVWSTMMIPQSFAANMMAGLLLLFATPGNLRFPAAGVGYLVFLLSRARAAWLSWLAGLFVFLFSLKARLQMRLIISIAVAMAIVLPVTAIAPFSTVITSRLQTFSNLAEDTSYQARLEGQNELFGRAILQFLGTGLGTKLDTTTSDIAAYDNGILLMLFTLGWFGTLPYLAGIGLLFAKLFQSSESRFDSFASAARAIAVSHFFVQIGLNPPMMGDFGMVLWGFLSLSLAAQKYYWHERQSN
jgi:hypothetical protein